MLAFRLLVVIDLRSFEHGIVSSKFWPISYNKGVEAEFYIRELYSIWLLLAPIGNLQGYWRPWYGSAVFLSWFRQHCNKFKRFFLGRVKFNWDDAEQGLIAGFDDAKITDSDFLSLLNYYCQNFVIGDYRRNKFARYVLASIVWRTQGKKALSFAIDNHCGLMWYEDEILFLSTKQIDYENCEWIDLKFKNANAFVWQISLDKNNEKLQIKIGAKLLLETRNSIKEILQTDTEPSFKMHKINSAISKYYNFAKYANYAKEQAWHFESWIWKKVNKSIIQIKPDLKKSYFNLKNSNWDLDFKIGRKSHLLDRDVSEEAWLNIWNPER